MTPYEFYSNVELFKHSQNKSDELAHYGTKGQRWGTRHWQNYDGTFNQAGKERYFGTGKSKNGVSDYLKFKKTATNEPAKEFGDFPGVKGLKRAFNNLKKFEFGSTNKPANEFGSIFNKKNVSYNDPKYNPRIDEENKIWDDVKEQQSKNWAKDKELINDLAGKELKYYSEDPIISEYYSNIKADIANKMKEKYPSMNPNTIRMNTLHDEDEPFVSGYDGQEELREQYKELHEKAIKYPPRSAKRVKLEGEAALVNAKEELNKKKIEEELNENVEKYIKENKNNILQDIDRIREKIKEISIDDDHGDYYVTRALEKHNKKKYNNFNEKGLKDLSDDEWDDVKNIAKAEYEDDISMQNKWNNNQKFGSSDKPFERKTDKDYIDKNGNFDDAKYDADKQRAIKELDTKYDKDFANVIKDNYDTTGEWGDVDAEYAKFKENPYDYLRKYSRDPKYNISDKEEKQLIKEAAKLNKAIAKGEDSIAEIMLSDRANNIKEESNKAFDKYVEEADKLKELFDDYDKDDANEKITAITGFTNGLIYSDKLGDLANSVYGYVYDDFDQGAGNSGYIYMLEKGYSDDDIRNMCKTNYENTEKFKSDIDTIIQKDPLLGKLDKANRIRLRNPISSGELRMNNRKIREYDDNSYRLQETGEGISGNYSNNVHKNLPEAKKLYKKVEKACSGKEYGWWYFNKAVQDLGLTNVSYKDLTNADWDKINAKISELAK